MYKIRKPKFKLLKRNSLAYYARAAMDGNPVDAVEKQEEHVWALI